MELPSSCFSDDSGTGKQADFVVRDRNLFTGEIRKAVVKLTVLDGRMVYRSGDLHTIGEPACQNSATVARNDIKY